MEAPWTPRPRPVFDNMDGALSQKQWEVENQIEDIEDDKIYNWDKEKEKKERTAAGWKTE